MESDVVRGRLDVAIVSWIDEPPPGLHSLIAAEERLAAAIGADHPWATRATVQPAELLEVPAVCLGAGTGVRAVYETMMSREGLPAPVTWEVSSPPTARALSPAEDSGRHC